MLLTIMTDGGWTLRAVVVQVTAVRALCSAMVLVVKLRSMMVVGAVVLSLLLMRVVETRGRHPMFTRMMSAALDVVSVV